MKVLIIRTAATEIDRAAYNLQEVGLARALIRMGHACDIVYYRQGSLQQKIELCVEGGRIAIYLMPAKNIAGDAWFGRALDELVPQYDVVQVSDCDRLYSLKACLRWTNVVVYHGPYANRSVDPGDILHRFRRVTFDVLLRLLPRRHSIRVLSKSKFATSDLKSKGFEVVRTVGVGLDAERFEPAVPREKEARYVLLSVGRFHPNKNQMFLLDVFEECLRLEPEIHLVMVGDGNDRYADAVKERLSASFAHTVTQIPSIAQTDMPKYYLGADLFLLPSTYEIFGMVLLEAAWFGCPVVTSRNGGSTTLIDSKDSGVVITPFDSRVWAKAVVGALHDEAGRSRMAARLNERVHRSFTWDAMAAVFVDEYTASRRLATE